MRVLIKNGNIVMEDEVVVGDISLVDGVIEGIGEVGSEGDFDEVYDAEGLYVLPGMIDVHTHMELQQSAEFRSCDDFYDGTVAAAVGGNTSIIDHIGFGPAGCSLHYSIDEYHEKAKKSVIDYGFHGVIQHVDEEILKELASIIENEGVTSFKAYTTYGFKAGDTDIYRLLETMEKSGGLLTVHCENDEITNYLRHLFIEGGKTDAIYHAKSRPNETEEDAVDTVINLASMTDSHVYIVHTSTAEAIERIRQAKKNGIDVYCETCPQYLFLDEESYYMDGNEEGVKFLCAPPLRTKNDSEAIWKAIEDGVVDVIATDHCPFLYEDKAKGIHDFTKAPGGMAGVEERVKLMFSEGVSSGRISIVQMAKLLSTNPAKIFGMYPKKGTIKAGSDADITIIDPNYDDVITAENSKSTCDYSSYEGFKIKGRIKYVFLRGKLIVEDDVFLGEKGDGEFIHRHPRTN